jgi:uncharacterized protein YbaR (Trm112 family)
MKRDLLKLIVCPKCKNTLELKVNGESLLEVTQGSLYCSDCAQFYMISSGIPDMIPPNIFKPKN